MSLSHLINDNSLYVSDKFFQTDLEKGIEKIRNVWRRQNEVADDATVIFYAPGNEKVEAEFTCENVRKGVKEFLLKYSSPTSLSPKASPLSKFVTVISLQQGSEGELYVREYLKTHNWLGKVIFVSDQDNGHLNAMCAADMGVIYDGQMVSSAVACHLPTLNLIKMRMHHQWYHDLFNRWWNDMNIVANNNVYPELIGGEAWFGKICDSLAEIYIRPDTRYDLIRKWDGSLQEALSYKPLDRSEVKTRDLILADGNAYKEYQDPFYVAAKNILADMHLHEQGHYANQDSLKNESVRVKFNT